MREKSPKRSSKRWIYLLMTTMMLITIVMSTGCSIYTSFSLREGDARFSFEYPRNYEKIATDLYSGYAIVWFARSLVEENWVTESSYLRVQVYEAGRRGNPDAKAALEDTITRFATDEHYRDFEIIDRSPVTIAGVAGEQVTFSYCFFESDPVLDYEGPFFKLPITFTVRCAYFDYNGFIWEIFLQSTEGMVDEDEAPFGHILETFTILD
jgi:hypothetical protein